MNVEKWKSKTGMIAAVAIIFFAGSSLITNADGNSTAPAGTIDDPLITKSYVDQQVASLVKQEVEAQLKNGPTPASGSQGAALTVVQLKAGQTLYAGAGAEFIVRTGKTIAVSSDENGIPDVTTGKDIQAGTAIELNHLLVFPREGRGIKPDPKNAADIFVMVRGSYTVLNADGTKAAP